MADTSVHSAYYLLASEYYKIVGPPQSFFSTALMYLAYTPLEALSIERQQEIATDIRYTMPFSVWINREMSKIIKNFKVLL